MNERLFGLTNDEGNHGEDVKEYYFYLDSTDTHSYMKYLYKYPQSAYPYDDLVKQNRQRSRHEMKYELLDTGIFNDDRYFDVFVEYAKETAEDLLIKITVVNRGPDERELHVLPTLWYRNNWSSWIAESNRSATKPVLKQTKAPDGVTALIPSHPLLGEYMLSCDGDVPLLFTENETNHVRLFQAKNNESAYCKDGINDHVVSDRNDTVNPDKNGTKASAHYQAKIDAGKTSVIRLRLTKLNGNAQFLGDNFDKVFDARLNEANDFYESVTPSSVNKEQADMVIAKLIQLYGLINAQNLLESGREAAFTTREKPTKDPKRGKKSRSFTMESNKMSIQ